MPKPEPKTPTRSRQRPLIGWREWVGFPDLGIKQVKAKIDTGARSSALHASNLELYRHRGERWVAFDVHPIQRDIHKTVHARARLLDERYVKNSGGKRELRPVIQTELKLGEAVMAIELTLTSRDVMGFRMLLGRQAVRGRYWIDPGSSYLIGPRPKKKKAKREKRKEKRG